MIHPNSFLKNTSDFKGIRLFLLLLLCLPSILSFGKTNCETSSEHNWEGCQGDGYTYIVDGVFYNEMNPSGVQTLNSANAAGCDSIVTVNLVFHPFSNSNENYVGCQGDGYSVVINGTQYDETNPSGVEIITNQFGCDSTITIDLVFHFQTSGVETYVGQVGDGYTVDVNGTTYGEFNPTGTEILTNSLGCDSIVTVDLVYNNQAFGEENYVGCIFDGYQVNVNGVIYDEGNPTGTETIVGGSIFGTDSTVTVNLIYNPTSQGEETYEGLMGDGYAVLVNGTQYDELNPTGVEVLPNSFGCDSTVNVNLTFLPFLDGFETYVGCEGDGYSVMVNGVEYNEINPTGTEVILGGSSQGLDSTVVINLTFNPTSQGLESYIGQVGDGYTVDVNGTTYGEFNPTGTEILTNSLGCDSIITIDLQFFESGFGEETYVGCEGDGYLVIVNGTQYDETNPSGTEVILNGTVNNTDSVVNVNLIYNPSTTGLETYIGCTGDGYSVAVGFTIYNEANASGVEVLTNYLGCDSIVTVNLVFNNQININETGTYCSGDGFSVIYNGNVYDENNPIGTETLTNNTCDTIVNINLNFVNLDTFIIGSYNESGNADGVAFISNPIQNNTTYEWSNGATGTFITNLSTGIYTVTITSLPSGCTSSYDTEIALDPINGGASNVIQGVVFFDDNSNCVMDFGETPIENQNVFLSGAYDLLIGTNNNGEFSFNIPGGTYDLSTNVPNSYWELCDQSYTANVTNPFDTVTINLPIQPSVLTPALSVEISTPLLRRCFSTNYYYVNYENNGTIAAVDPYVEIILDEHLVYLNSSIPFNSSDGNSLTFELDDIPVGGSGSFWINIYVDCVTTSLGQILCTEAHIYPDVVPSVWNGAFIMVEGECVGLDVEFRIQNVGTGDMSGPKDYIVIEDAVLRTSGMFNLLSGEEEIVTLPGNPGAVTWLLADQIEGAPAPENAGYFVQDCQNSGGFPIGQGNLFTLSDIEEAVDTDCTEIIGSYDPNAKSATPVGFLEEHYIEEGTELEYLIQFQNTGTDTAFTVVLVDTLSSLLDLSTFEVLVGSHDFTYEVVPERALKFHFENILLPDSTTNEELSHGFVKFKILPHADLAPGTLIENFADIYFDFNEPIRTDTAYHTLWEETIFDFILSDSDELNLSDQAEINIFPNPFSKQTTIDIKGEYIGPFEIVLYDLTGKIVYQKQSNASKFDIRPQHLSRGMYFFEIKSKDGILGNGKINAH